MSNLIITIISIGLVAIAAIMGIYYGGQAYSNAQINAVANAIVNEAQQILAAERIWSTNNNQPDISGMGTAGANGTGMSMLVSSESLAEWPSFAGNNIAFNTSLAKPGPQPSLANIASTVTIGTADYGCYNINGYIGRIHRFMFSYNNGNYVIYYFLADLPPYAASCDQNSGNFASTNTDVSQINHPIVKIAKAINAAMGQIAANANLAPMSYVGLPRPPSGYMTISANAYDTSGGYAVSKVMVDANGNIQTNYCYLAGMPAVQINCVFGPS